MGGMPPPAWGGIGCPGGGSPGREGAELRGHPWAIVGVLLSPRGVDETQAGVPHAGGVEKVDQSFAPPRVVGGPLLAAAVVEVFIDALVEAFPHRCRPRVVVVGEGVVSPVVPMPRRRVWHRQVARVAVPQLGGAQRDDVARGGTVVGRGLPWGTRWGCSAPLPGRPGPGVCGGPSRPLPGLQFWDGVVHLGAYAVRTGDFPQHPGDLGAHGG